MFFKLYIKGKCLKTGNTVRLALNFTYVTWLWEYCFSQVVWVLYKPWLQIFQWGYDLKLCSSFIFLETEYLCSSGCTGTHYIDQLAGVKLSPLCLSPLSADIKGLCCTWACSSLFLLCSPDCWLHLQCTPFSKILFCAHVLLSVISDGQA